MRESRITRAIVMMVVLCGPIPAFASDQASAPVAATSAPSGAHDFDFQFGEWRVHHRVKRPATKDWMEFDGTSSVRPVMGGSANVEDNRFNKASGVTRGVALRAFDQETGLWAIWWVDGRAPHGPIDPPVKGRFGKGVGTFYSDGAIDGKAMRVRYTWSRITPRSARWEQAYSFDGEKSWDTNWVMDFERTS